MKNNEISVVIGSWGSYNACNERALGSEWLDLDFYDSWNEIVEELEKEGFELDGIDQELFIQDIDGLDVKNCDSTSPKWLFEIVKASEILEDESKYKKAMAYIEINGFDDWARLVDNYSVYWDNEIYLYEDMDMVDVAYEIVEGLGYLDGCPEIVQRYFDYDAFARDLTLDGCFSETSYGILETR